VHQPGPGLGSSTCCNQQLSAIQNRSQPEATPQACCRRTALEQPLLGTTTSRLTAHRTPVLSDAGQFHFILERGCYYRASSAGSLRRRHFEGKKPDLPRVAANFLFQAELPRRLPNPLQPCGPNRSPLLLGAATHLCLCTSYFRRAAGKPRRATRPPHVRTALGVRPPPPPL
jgi:hypothetical protein